MTFKKVEFQQYKIIISKCASCIILASYAFFARTNENRDHLLHAVSWDTHTGRKSTRPAFYKTSIFKRYVSCSPLGDYTEQIIVQNHGAYTL